MKKLKYIVLIGFSTLMLAIGVSAYQAEQPQTMADLTITQFTDGLLDGFTATENGLVVLDDTQTAVYTSPEIATDIPFNALVPNWIANQEIGFLIRTRPHNGDWTEWQTIETHADWNDPTTDRSFGEMVLTPNADQLHSHIQYSVSLSQSQDQPPANINEISFTFINSTGGPTTAEMLAQQQAINAMSGVASEQDNPRPAVISREVWCIDPDCDYTEDLEYAPATHLIVHHTVSSNQGSNYDWAAVVRAIWHYHTYDPNHLWGDVGYNYLIDTNGVIYEGHQNEDYENLDVAGIHASGANTGSLGVSLIGNFSLGEGGAVPSQPMLNSLIDIMAWKAEQRNINVYDVGNTLPNVNWGLPYLMGHRDVYGTTQCPGDQMHILLPWLRDQVADRLNLTDPYLYVQEQDAAFTKSNSTWYESNFNCGHNLHAYYTWSTTTATNNKWGEWKINVPENGRYRIAAHIPYCRTGQPETDGAAYTINHALGSSNVILSQNDNVGMWMTLGTFNFTTNGNQSVRLSNLTTTDYGLGVWFDSLRLIRVDNLPEPEQTIHNELPTTQYATNNPNIAFAWTISNTYAVLSTTLQISPDETFNDLTHTESWPTINPPAAYTVTQDGNYYWQVNATLDNGNGGVQTITSPATSFIFDTAVPTSAITKIYKIPSTGYLFYWQGNDTLSGIATYNLQVRQPGITYWTDWLTNTAVTSAIFQPPNPNGIYEFRIQATDKANNQEAVHPTADISSEQAILLPHAIMLPLVTR